MPLSPPLSSRVRADHAEIALRVRRTLARRVGRTAPWTAAETALVRDTIDFVVSLVVDSLVRPRPVPEDLLDSCRDIAAAAGRHRVAPAEVADCAGLVAVTLQAQLWQRARPGDRRDLAALAVPLEQAVGQVRDCMRDAHFAQLRRDGFAPGAARRVAAALVAGRATDEMLRAVGCTPVRRYRVIAVRADLDTDARVVIGDALPQVPGALSCTVDGDDVIIEPAPEETGDDQRSTGISALLRNDPRFHRAAVVVEPADGVDGVAGAARTARGQLDEALRLGRLGRPTTRSELVLESRLLDGPTTARRLRALVSTLDHDPDLVRTLQVLYLNDLDRTRTAQDLGIARRTLAYRTQRIRELTGVHPTSTRGVQVLGPAVAVLRALDVDAR